MTLLELMIALTVFALGMGSAVFAMIRTTALSESAHERELAMQAVEGVMESLQAANFREVFARYNATAADDPADGVSPGRNFDAVGLEAVEGDADGLPGEIVFPGNGFVLREDFDDARLGMPRDLNADGDVDNDDHTTYRVLPVLVRVRWHGASGDQVLQAVTVLSNDRNEP